VEVHQAIARSPLHSGKELVVTSAAAFKVVPTDFLVRESLALSLTGRGAATHHYLLLRKQGYTTMEAVRGLAERLGIDARTIGYAGLKDEDGVTEQLISVPLANSGEAITGVTMERAGAWLELHHYGFAEKGMTIGDLDGNSFQCVLRNVTSEDARRLRDRRKMNLFFLNYYDTQRFGVPGGPRQSHLVGEAILAGEWKTARDRLIELRAPESRLAEEWIGQPEEFFRQLDPRTVSFFLSAYASYDWNAALRAIVAEQVERPIEEHFDALAYSYPGTNDGAVRVMAAASELPVLRYNFRGGTITHRRSTRQTVVQTMVEVRDHAADEVNPGRERVTVNFFLPSGSYATSALRQLLLTELGGADSAIRTTAR
jgi:tRNA pseudouridine13 synthase